MTSSRNSHSTLASGIQSPLEEARSDVIMLHDAYYSADTAITRLSYFRGVTELIAACDFAGIAPGPGPNSFTAALISSLVRLYTASAPFSFSDLVSKIIA